MSVPTDPEDDRLDVSQLVNDLTAIGLPVIVIDEHTFNDPPPIPESTTQKRIRELNDLARTAMGVASLAVQTAGIRALPLERQSLIRERVELFNDFTPANDPYGEHDFGSFSLEDGTRIHWKIDYYNRDLTAGSEHPENPEETRRVLTIMLAEEY